MKTLLIISLTCYILATALFAGSINVVQVGSKNVVRFEVKAGDASMNFTLANGASTGLFVLPDEDATIKGFKDGIPELEVPVSEDPRIAILLPTDDGFEWKLLEAKPSEDEWAFRIVNLSAEVANVIANKKLIEIPSEKEQSVEVFTVSQINLKIPSTVDLSFDGGEPTGVVAFVYRDEDEWKAILLPDR